MAGRKHGGKGIAIRKAVELSGKIDRLLRRSIFSENSQEST
ncbi:hypothetical protein [Piscinibacter sakaiensis]